MFQVGAYFPVCLWKENQLLPVKRWARVLRECSFVRWSLRGCFITSVVGAAGVRRRDKSAARGTGGGTTETRTAAALGEPAESRPESAAAGPQRAAAEPGTHPA